MAVRRIGVGIAGYGLAGRVFHATLVGHTPGLALRAVFSRTAERRAQAQHDHPGIAVHASYEALLADPSVEMVVVATPHDTHAAMVVAAAGAGKHVVVDKIMCLTVDEGEQMIGAARRAGVLFSVFQNRRWDSDYLTVKRVLASGLVGEPYVIESAVTSFGPSPGYRAPTSDRPRGWRSYAEFGGGPMRDWGAHLFDQAVQLVGPRPEWLFADFQYRRDWDVETAGTAWLRYSASEPPSGQVLPYGGAGTPVRGGRGSRGLTTDHRRALRQDPTDRRVAAEGRRRARACGSRSRWARSRRLPSRAGSSAARRAPTSSMGVTPRRPRSIAARSGRG